MQGGLLGSPHPAVAPLPPGGQPCAAPRLEPSLVGKQDQGLLSSAKCYPATPRPGQPHIPLPTRPRVGQGQQTGLAAPSALACLPSSLASVLFLPGGLLRVAKGAGTQGHLSSRSGEHEAKVPDPRALSSKELVLCAPSCPDVPRGENCALSQSAPLRELLAPATERA